MRRKAIEKTRGPAAGFSLVELLVVMAIIAVLAGVAVVAVNSARDVANAAASKSTLSSVSMGLQRFENDFGRYPPSRIDPSHSSFMAGWEGGEILAQMMVGPAEASNDGVDGSGYKEYRPSSYSFASSSSRGKTYGPYVSIDGRSSVLIRWDKNGNGEVDGSEFWGRRRQQTGAYALNIGRLPLLFYRKYHQLPGGAGARSRGDLDESTPDDRLWGPKGMFDTDHNRSLIRLTNAEAIGIDDNPDNDPDNYSNIVVDGYWAKDESNGGPSDEEREQFETALRAADYLLVATGPDDVFGTADDVWVTGP